MFGQSPEHGIAQGLHGLADLRLDDDEFAHLIDQGVELVRSHPDTGGSLLASVLGMLASLAQFPHGPLLGQGRIHPIVLGRAAIRQNVAQATLAGQGRRQILGRDVAPLHQNFAQTAMHLVRSQGTSIVEEIEGQIALILDEHEHIGYALAPGPGSKDAIPPRETGLGIEVVQILDAVHMIWTRSARDRHFSLRAISFLPQ